MPQMGGYGKPKPKPMPLIGMPSDGNMNKAITLPNAGGGMKQSTDMTGAMPSAGGMKTPDAQGMQGAYDAAQASSAASMSGAQDAQMRILGALKNQFKKPRRMA